MAHRYRFDCYELDTSERLLYRDGQPVGVGARAVSLLTTLVRRHGRLVTKAELLDLVWPGLVVEENNLQVQISALRKVLGARMIVTVPGRGYRFVEPLAGSLDLPASSPTWPPPGVPVARESAHESAHEPASAPPRVPSPTPSRPLVFDALSVLPVQATRLLGRERDQAALDALLPAPLITVVGPSGIGKTALALAAAHRWRADRPDGAAWVDLADLRTPDQVVVAVSQSLGLSAAGGEPVHTLAWSLKPLKLLIVLDNAEQVLDGVVALVTALLAEAPGVRLLVTSQVPLKVDGERVFRLGPLSVPSPQAGVDEALTHGAVALFVDQVRAIDRRFQLQPEHLPAIVELCERLDGLALAIKLAAARVPLLGLPGVTQRLGERFRLLSGQQSGVPARHQTLMAALDWSHGLLSASEQAMFRRLAVFAGGFPLCLVSILGEDHGGGERMDEWQVLDTLGSLADRSLVTVEGSDRPRYRLLDSMRDYAELKLADSGEQARLQRHHAHAVAALMEAAYQAYWQEPDAAWLARFGCDIDNVRAALDWAGLHDPELAVALMGACGPLFLLLGLAPEGRRRGHALLSVADAMGPQPAARRYWLEFSRLHWGVDNASMCAWAQRAGAAFREAGDARGLYLAMRCMAGSGMLSPDEARGLLRDMAALEQADWPARLLTQRLLAEVSVLRALEHMADARRVCQTLLVRAQSAGLDGVMSAGLSDLAAICLALGDTDAALRVSQQILARARNRRDNFVVHALAIVACVAFVRSDLPQARATLSDFVAACRIRSWEWLGLYAGLLALLAALEGRHEAAARLLGYTDQACRHVGSRDVLAVYAWSRAHAAVQDALEPTVLQRLLDQGRQLDPESVCTWALGQPPA
ncbi:MAG: helix-turn-helix transcriptional regulator [Burkholderiales bacterium]|nr:helix-turn-helix transcriptional regulator [Burkholderiales bacterium]